VECLRQIEDLFKKGEPLAYDAILIVAKKWSNKKEDKKEDNDNKREE
jgi:hypothetical protein